MAETSFAQVAEEHLDAVYAFLLYLTGDRTVADDLTGETFERALARWRRFDPRRGTAKTWLCQLARSAALDHFRSESRRSGGDLRVQDLTAEPRACSVKGLARSWRRRCTPCLPASAR